VWVKNGATYRASVPHVFILVGYCPYYTVAVAQKSFGRQRNVNKGEMKEVEVSGLGGVKVVRQRTTTGSDMGAPRAPELPSA
jgi:hypothetical protein